jgi:hypothetical protein
MFVVWLLPRYILSLNNPFYEAEVLNTVARCRIRCPWDLIELPTRVTRFGDFSPLGSMFTLAVFCENYRSSTDIIGLLLSTEKLLCKLSQKKDWATFCATFSQTHLVALLSTSERPF